MQLAQVRAAQDADLRHPTRSGAGDEIRRAVAVDVAQRHADAAGKCGRVGRRGAVVCGAQHAHDGTAARTGSHRELRRGARRKRQCGEDQDASSQGLRVVHSLLFR